MNSTSVLIAGGGPVGLSLALVLNHYGIDSVVIERNATTTDDPRANGLRPRSMELFRQLGLERELLAGALDAMKARNPDIAARGAPGVSFSESLVGRELGRVAPSPDLGRDLSPAAGFPAQQDILERRLFEAAGRCPHVQLGFSTEFLSFEQDDAHVTVRTRAVETGAVSEWSAAFLVGADGTASATRTQAGIAFEGSASLVTGLRESWQADLSRHPQIRRQGGLIVSPDPDVAGSSVAGMLPDGTRRSTFFGLLGPNDRERPWDDPGAVRAIRRQVGIRDLDIELKGWSTFRMGNRVAARFRDRRVLLAGDAAHTFPASGGFGLNTGLGDVHNLGWKLAFVLRGLAADQLLDTYEVERWPIAKDNGDWSTRNLPRLGNPTPDCPVPPIVAAVRSGNADRIGFAFEDLKEWAHSTGRTFGQIYGAGAVVPDGTATPAFDSRRYAPTDHPGARFPHVWVDPCRTQSSLDWFDRDFTLVAGPMGSDWLDAGRKVSEKLGLPLALQTLPNVHPENGFEMGLRGAVLVRPDGHVAWRRAWLDDDPADELAGVLTTLLR